MLCVWVLTFLGGSLALEEIQISKGVRLVEIASNEVEPRGLDGSVSSAFRRFLSTHELEIKLDELLPASEDVQRGLQSALGYLNIWNNGEFYDLFSSNVLIQII